MKASLAVCLLLAACSGGGGTPDEVCAREAENSPAVRELVIKGLGNPNFQWTNDERLKLARKDATLACLRRYGLVPKGGVERPRI